MSQDPTGKLRDLCDRANRARELEQFIERWLSKDLQHEFQAIAQLDCFDSEEEVWETLRGMRFVVEDERNLDKRNVERAEQTLEGAQGAAIVATLGSYLETCLGQSICGRDISEELSQQGIRRIGWQVRESARTRVEEATETWQNQAERFMFTPKIQRPEVETIVSLQENGGCVFVLGGAGSGKTSVVAEVGAKLRSSGTMVLGLRIDRYEGLETSVDLGHRLGVDTSPVSLLARAAAGGPCCLIIDQVDAYSWTAGRLSSNSSAVIDLVDEAMRAPGMSVILACRKFDLMGDRSLRALAETPGVHKLELGLLDESDVQLAVVRPAPTEAVLSKNQVQVLRVPLHLAIYLEARDHGFSDDTWQLGELFARYFDHKREACLARSSQACFDGIVERFVAEATTRRSLSVPRRVLARIDGLATVDVLLSENLLVEESHQVSFFHDSVFDYACAQQWLCRDQRLSEFLKSTEQGLYHRTTTRQILQYFASEDPQRFLEEACDLLHSADIRVHIKEVVLLVLGQLETPNRSHLDLLAQFIDKQPLLFILVTRTIRSVAWFSCAYETGHLPGWLNSAEKQVREWALQLMKAAVEMHPEDVVYLLKTSEKGDDYASCLAMVLRHQAVSEHEGAFRLLLDALISGHFGPTNPMLWYLSRELGTNQPKWALQLLHVILLGRDGDTSLSGSGLSELLAIREYLANELLMETASSEPLDFVRLVLPRLLTAMEESVYSETSGRYQNHRAFAYLLDEDALLQQGTTLGDALYFACMTAMERLADTSRQALEPIFRDLANEPFDGAQVLVWKALASSGENLLALATELLTDDAERLQCSNSCDGTYPAADVVRAITADLSDEQHHRLEQHFIVLAPPEEKPKRYGYMSFVFLSLLDESRLSARGSRRLDELKRKFETIVSALPSSGELTFESPIDIASAANMEDDHWLQAMCRYDSSEEIRGLTAVGAEELAMVLEQRSAAEPDRFAGLAVKVTSAVHSSYGAGLLAGILAVPRPIDTDSRTYRAVQHLLGLEHGRIDVAFGRALTKFRGQVPKSLVGFICDRAINSTHPETNPEQLVSAEYEQRYVEHLAQFGYNTARGQLTYVLAQEILCNGDNREWIVQRVIPIACRLASDPVLAVRACTAVLIKALINHDSGAALKAFGALIDTDDVVLAAPSVRCLILRVGAVDKELAVGVIERMVRSDVDVVRQAGGKLALHAVCAWGKTELETVVAEGAAAVRVGWAQACSESVTGQSDVYRLSGYLSELLKDEDAEVVEAASGFVCFIGDRQVGPYRQLVCDLIQSRGFDFACGQLFRMLSDTCEDVDDLVVEAARRFLHVFGDSISDSGQAVSADAVVVAELVARRSAGSDSVEIRHALLDVLDDLVVLDTYGIQETMDEVPRSEA